MDVPSNTCKYLYEYIHKSSSLEGKGSFSLRFADPDLPNLDIQSIWVYGILTTVDNKGKGK